MDVPDFAEFWSLYPRHQAKAVAEKSWRRMNESNRDAAIEALPNHLRYWVAMGTEMQYIPLPATWLSQERWEDELEMPTFDRLVAWWATDGGILKKGAELGIQPRPGEEMGQFKQRVVQSVRRVA